MDLAEPGVLDEQRGKYSSHLNSIFRQLPDSGPDNEAKLEKEHRKSVFEWLVYFQNARQSVCGAGLERVVVTAQMILEARQNPYLALAWNSDSAVLVTQIQIYFNGWLSMPIET